MSTTTAQPVTTATAKNGHEHRFIEHYTNNRGEQFTITEDQYSGMITLHDHAHQLAYNSSAGVATVKEWAERHTSGTEYATGRPERADLGAFPENYLSADTWVERDYKAELEALWAALHTEANRRGFCEEYDRFAAEHGGPKRPRNVTVRVGFVVPVETTEDNAEAVLAGKTIRQRQALIQEAAVEHLVRQGYLDKEDEAGHQLVRTIVRVLVAANPHTQQR